jgi:hypothetical protein
MLKRPLAFGKGDAVLQSLFQLLEERPFAAIVRFLLRHAQLKLS